MSEVYVKMTEEEAARRWAAKEGLCLIDWGVLEQIRKHAPAGMLMFDVKLATYRLVDESAAHP